MKWFEKKAVTVREKSPWIEKISSKGTLGQLSELKSLPQTQHQNSIPESKTPIGDVFFKFIELTENQAQVKAPKASKEILKTLGDSEFFERQLTNPNADIKQDFIIEEINRQSLPEKSFFKIHAIAASQPKIKLKNLFDIPPIVESPELNRSANVNLTAITTPTAKLASAAYDLSFSTAFIQTPENQAVHLQNNELPQATESEIDQKEMSDDHWLHEISHKINFTPIYHTLAESLPDVTEITYPERDPALELAEETDDSPEIVASEEIQETTEMITEEHPTEVSETVADDTQKFDTVPHTDILTDAITEDLEEQTSPIFESESEMTIEEAPAPSLSSSLKKILSPTLLTGPASSPQAPITEANPKDDVEENASVTPLIQLQGPYLLDTGNLKIQNDSNVANPAETQSTIAKLETTLKTFGIEGRVAGMQRGPIITRFEIKMAPGIKVAKIAGLTDELAMALEAFRVRIEAPIPGRSTVGIEIPNKKRAQVLLGDIINDSAYKEFEGQLPLPLGKDIAGNIVIEDLCKMPHLLIAGATGSGKSVSVNSFIISMILRKSPEQLRLILIDPKLVELSQYNDIPHLLHPVITEANKAVLALNWLVEEMERRYEDMADWRARDISSYNEKINLHNERLLKKVDPLAKSKPIMPHIVVLIDELGDLMMVAGKEVESAIIRISQKARAVGIHLILATQRPSVDVITALIKANCPARLALQVAQKTDSRTILDSNGAETLLGRGDFLFKHPSKGQLIRVQAPLVSDEEVERIVETAKKISKPCYITLEDTKAGAAQLEDEDELLFDEAWQIIIESQKASASYLQRRLRIGYNRAARLIEAFEARGYIGPQIGSKPREILLK